MTTYNPTATLLEQLERLDDGTHYVIYCEVDAYENFTGPFCINRIDEDGVTLERSVITGEIRDITQESIDEFTAAGHEYKEVRRLTHYR